MDNGTHSFRIGQAYAYHRVMVEVLNQIGSSPANLANLLRDLATDALYKTICREATKLACVDTTLDVKEFIKGLSITFSSLRNIPIV